MRTEAAAKLAELSRIISHLKGDERLEVEKLLTKSLPVWVPLPGPQTEAYECKADVLYYGGSAGGGKTDLLLGLALTKHKHSIIYRRQSTQLIGIQSRLLDDIVKSRKGWNGQADILRLSDRIIEFGACNNVGDEIKYQGRPHSLKGFDEITHFTEAQFRFLCGWKRSVDEHDPQRVVCTGNPPTNSEGQWVITYWAPWLDPQHPNPAKPGELRWFTTVDGKDQEFPDGSPVIIDGKSVKPLSRTFIPSRVHDNPFLIETGYEATLQALPEPLRSQMLEGDFRAGMEDSVWQTIPTKWIEEAQARWTPDGKQGKLMDSAGVDVARGGLDKFIISTRYGRWYDALKETPGVQVPDGAIGAGLVVSVVRDHAPVHVDVIGVGSSVVDHLKDNNIHVVPINNAEAATLGAVDKMTGKMGFRNKRAETYWRFREMLDPASRENIALPPDSELKADLCAPMWKLTPHGIQIESKEEVIKRLGRSPDKGDAVVLAAIQTQKIISSQVDFRKHVSRGTWRSR